MTTAAPPVTGAMPRPLAVALKHRVSPSPVRVEMREEPVAGGGGCSLRLLCSVTSSYEQQLIGEPELDVEEEEDEEEEPTDYEIPLDGLDLCSHDACRAAVLKLLSAIPVPVRYPCSTRRRCEWYEPVLRAAAGDIVSQLHLATSGEETRGYAVDVSLSIQETFKFVQPEALLLACEQAAIPGSRTPGERCAICMERLPMPAPADARPAPTVCMEEKMFTLPSCGHTFHQGCITAWFEKGSTCPLCRCDMMYCLNDIEKKFGIR